MKTAIPREKFLKLLTQQKNLDEAQLNATLKESQKSGKSVLHMLTEREYIKEDELIILLSKELKIPTLNLSALQIPRAVICLVPKKLIEKYQIFPVARIGDVLTIATSDPFDILLQDDVREIVSCDLCFVLATPRMITTAIESYYGDAAELEQMIGSADVASIELVRGKKDGDDGQPENGEAASKEEDAAIVRMVKLILEGAIKRRASDIHFEPYENDFRIRYRIDGALRETFTHSRDFYSSLVARIKIMSHLDITERRIPQDGRFRVRTGEREIDFRVSVLPIYHGEKLVLRVLDKGGVKAGLEHLGFSEKPTAVFANAIKEPYGMILVTGPTGSGKSTTLYTILNSMNTPERNIMTVEDPVEYQVEGITQTQVNTEVGLTFAGGLRCLLRQSPDIILVGEMRDTETADIGVKAALTGHLVFSTLHTNSAAGAMTRLADMGIEPFLISSSVVCVAAQRLLRKNCDFCKAPYKIPEEQIRRTNLPLEIFKSFAALKGQGCAKCSQTGYFGRLAAVEVFRMDNDIRTLIIEGKSSDIIEAKAVENGMETLFQNAFNLFKQGLTTLEEVLRVSSNE